VSIAGVAMKAMAYISGMLAIACVMAGCADEKSVPVQPVSIKAESFCEVMKAVLPPTGKPSWDIVDSKPTITDARRIGAAVDKRCNRSSNQTPTS